MAAKTKLIGAQQRLARDATLLKKSFLVLAACHEHRLTSTQRTMPSYNEWTRKQLEPHVRDLWEDVGDRLEPMAEVRPSRRLRAVRWFAGAYDKWQSTEFGLLSLGTVHDFENQVGPLRARAQLDLPPYAELLLQGAVGGLAFRHPEYHLARDLALLQSLFLDAEELVDPINWSDPPDWAATARENSQSLARAVVIACFNLLESFVAGLARSHVMTTPSLNDADRKTLLDNKGSLEKRMQRVLRLIKSNAKPLDLSKPPISDLLSGWIKQHRDAYVHCEPGPEPSRTAGHVKEPMFHHAGKQIVADAISALIETIRTTWGYLHGNEGPRWLPERDAAGRLSSLNLRLRVP